MICPYCNSKNITTTGGENGNPFDRRKEKHICENCGRTLPQNDPASYSGDSHVVYPKKKVINIKNPKIK